MSREILGYVYSSATLILGGDCSQESEPDQLQSKISTAVGQVQIPDCSHPPSLWCEITVRSTGWPLVFIIASVQRDNGTPTLA